MKRITVGYGSAGLLFLAMLALLFVFATSVPVPLSPLRSPKPPSPAAAAAMEPAIESMPYDWVRQNPLISHALGGVGTYTGTNSRESLERAYRNGLRVFETDIIVSSDGHLVLRHDWGPGTYSVLGQKVPPGGAVPLTLNAFKSMKIEGAYMPMTFKELVSFMSDHPDMLLVTDTKEPDADKAEAVFEKLVDEASAVDPGVLRRIIPQLYHPDNYDAVSGVYPFSQYIYTLYMNQDSVRQVVDFTSGKGIAVVVMDENHYSPELVAALKEKGVYSYINTIDDVAKIKSYIASGVQGVMTDFVVPADL